MYSGGALGVVVCSRRATGFSVVSVVVLGEGVRLVFRVVRSGPSPPLGLRGDECQILLVRATACKHQGGQRCHQPRLSPHDDVVGPAVGNLSGLSHLDLLRLERHHIKRPLERAVHPIERSVCCGDARHMQADSEHSVAS